MKTIYDKERLWHIRVAIAKIRRYSENLTEQDFLEQEMTQDAILYQFSIIGEAIAHVDNTLLDKYEYAWYAVRAFRNYIAYEYFGINLEKVWNAVEINIPELDILVNTILLENF